MNRSRHRDLSWQDPRELVRAAECRSGLEFLRAVVDGELSPAPFFPTLGIQLVEVEEGMAVFEGEPDESSFNLIGSVHGGYSASLIDSATGCAVYTTLAEGDRWTT